MLKKIILIIIIIIALFIVARFIRFKNQMVYGVSFNSQYARYLGLDPAKVYTALFEKWHFKYIRLSAQWNAIETADGQYDFGELDRQMDEAARQGAKISLALGQKTPRWPECHAPAWTAPLTDEQYYTKLHKFMAVVVNRYRDHTALEIWQVENEAFLPFGVSCRPFTPALLADEIALTRSLDTAHRILITDSGELSSWRLTARAGDLFGTTMYRVVWTKSFGYFNYDWLPAIFYRAKLFFNGRSVDQAFVAELQAEPWIPDNNLLDTPLAEQYQSMNIKRLQTNLDFAASTGMPRAYLWGVEWWYWLETRGETAISEVVKSVKKF
ncbi:MAG: beta-galactosidase [Candidatus Magasanikbacteria bacterium]|jgi:hypothetical protein